MSRPKTLNFITSNPHKLQEFRGILGDALEKSGITLTSQSVDVVEVQAQHVEDVSRDKARRAAEAVNGAVLVEDTALSFNAMGGLPGPYIKYFATTLGVANLHLMLAGFPDKSAQAICTFAYTAGPGQEVILFQGRTDGKIVPARGPQDFGWDSAFEYEGKTYAEMTKEAKGQVSHRGKALVKLRAWLEGKDA